MLILDIETVPDESKMDYLLLKKSTLNAPSNWKDQEKIKANIDEQFAKLVDKASLSPRTGRTMMVGFLSDKKLNDFTKGAGELFKMQITSITPETEKELLKTTFRILSEFFDNSNELLVTYNGKKFDLPFLYIRAMLNNIDGPISMPGYKILTSPYNDNTHLDLFNSFNEGTLSEWSYMFNDSNTFSSDGNQILQQFREANYDWILQKNLDDLYKTYYLAERVKLWLL